MFKSLRKKALLLLLVPLQSHDTNVAPSSANYEQVLKQVRDFETALQAMDYLLDDETETGTKLLRERAAASVGSVQPSAIFDVALGVMEFIEATLGFEPEVIQRAHNTLLNAEVLQLNNFKYNSKHHLVTSNIYPPGTEFQVTYAELTLLNALLMLLTENSGMLEGAKALFKLRRAYQTLDSIYNRVKELEPIFNKNLAKLQKEASMNHLNLSNTDLPGYKLDSDSVSLYSNSDSESLSPDLQLMKSLEQVYQMRKTRIEGTAFVSPSQLDLFHEDTPCPEQPKYLQSNLGSRVESDEDDSDEDFADALESQSVLDKNEKLLNPKLVDEKLSGPDSSFTSSFSSKPNGSTADFTIASSINSSIKISSLAFAPGSGAVSPKSAMSVASVSSTSNSHLHVSTIDEFIHSGVQLCVGILQVVLSLIPPTIGKVLSVVGFKGNKEEGLKMLWRTAITSRNIHGELALLAILIFYDGPIQFIDLGYQLPGHEDSSSENVLNIESRSTISEAEMIKVLNNPTLYTPQLLLKARKYFPHNALWHLQEGRTMAAQGKLYEAIEVMQAFTDNPSNKIKMQQVEALLVFDRGMFYAFAHDFDSAARDFIYLIDINSWSKAVYLFMAALCYLAKYRLIKMDLIEVEDKDAELKKYGDLAKKYFDLAPTYVPGHGINAKKGGIGGANKQMPFDKFLMRKLKNIAAVQKEHPDLPFIDCFGTSPIHELIYFWNGYKRMRPRELEITIKALGYSGGKNAEYSANNDTINYAKIEETTDEAMIRYFFQSIALRELGKVAEGLSLLDTQVVDKFVVTDSPFKFTKMTYSPYLYPTSFHEKSMFVWRLRTSALGDIVIKNAVQECKGWLTKALTVGEGDYELSNATNLKIKAAGDRLDNLLTKVK